MQIRGSSSENILASVANCNSYFYEWQYWFSFYIIDTTILSREFISDNKLPSKDCWCWLWQNNRKFIASTASWVTSKMSKIYIVCKVEYEAVILWWAGRSKKSSNFGHQKISCKKGWHPGINSKLLTEGPFQKLLPKYQKSYLTESVTERCVCFVWHFLKIVILLKLLPLKDQSIQSKCSFQDYTIFSESVCWK